MRVKNVKLPLYVLLGICLFFLAFQPETNAESEYVSVQVNVLNVRSGPGTSHNIVDQVTKGNILSVVEKLDHWYHVQLTNGLTGWVAKRYVDYIADLPALPLPKESMTFSSSTHLQDLYGTSLSTLQHKTIMIDAGHGGRDNGATGTSAATLEKDLNLITAKLLEKRLKALGANVIMTRTEDDYISLEKRVTLAKQKNVDAFLSIHYNSSSDSTLQGIMTFYDEHKILAESIHNELVSLTAFDDKRIRYGDYYVLRENTQPSVLIELGFLSHKNEESLVQTEQFQYNAVTAIVKGLVTYFSGKDS